VAVKGTAPVREGGVERRSDDRHRARRAELHSHAAIVISRELRRSAC